MGVVQTIGETITIKGKKGNINKKQIRIIDQTQHYTDIIFWGNSYESTLTLHQILIIKDAKVNYYQGI